MRNQFLVMLLVSTISSYGFPKDPIPRQPKIESVTHAFKKQVDPSLITKEFTFKKLGSIRVLKAVVRVFLYESIFGESQRVTRRLVFIDGKNKFIGMYGNFSEMPLSITGNDILFEPDPAYKNEQALIIPHEEIPKEIRFRGEKFQLFGLKGK